MMWENYELAAREGQVSYTIEVVFERMRAAATGKVAVDLINNLANMIGVDHEGDRVTYTFERKTSHAPVLLDLLSIGLQETPAGDYKILVKVTDRYSGRTSRASSNFSVSEGR